MANLLETAKDVGRLNEILKVAAEEGFGYIISKIKLKHKAKDKSNPKTLPEARLRRFLERLGPTFVKLGQVLSLRPDLLPKSYTLELEKLLEHAQPVPFSQIKQTIEKELEKPIDEIFATFNKRPIAAASISQVHKAKLKTGETVIVKVQRPNIKKIMHTDIHIMFIIARLIEKHIPSLREYNPVMVVQQFNDWTQKELDFKVEARNALRFKRNFNDTPHVIIPKVYDNLVTHKVLVMEFIDAISMTNDQELKKLGVNIPDVMRLGFQATFAMVFEHGLFHADPHPANILVTKDGDIAFVDFGIVGHFNEKLKHKSVDLVAGIIENDVDLIVNTFMTMGFNTQGVDIDEFKEDIRDVLDAVSVSKIKDLKLSHVLDQIISIPLKHNFKIPPQFVLFGKTIVTLEGIALQYDPDFNIVDATKPYITRLMLKRANPMYHVKNFMHSIRRYERIAQDLPDKADKALETLATGKIKIDVRDLAIDDLAFEIDKSSNRIAYGLVIAALLLTAAISMAINRGPMWHDMPIIALISFVIALILGFFLFASILREKRPNVHVK